MAAFAVDGSCEVTSLDRSDDAMPLFHLERGQAFSHPARVQAQFYWWLHNATLDPTAPELAVSLPCCWWHHCRHHHRLQQSRPSIFMWHSQITSTTKILQAFSHLRAKAFPASGLRGRGSSSLWDPGTACISCLRIPLFPRGLILETYTPEGCTVTI